MREARAMPKAETEFARGNITVYDTSLGRRSNACLGLATMCIGVGQGIAMVVEKV